MTEHPVGKKRLDCCCPVSLAINASVGKLFIISTATMCTAFALGLILLVTLTEQTSVTRTKRQCPCAYFPPSSCSCRASLTPRCTCEQQPSVNQPVVFTNPFATADILPQQPAIGQEPSLLPDNISTLSPQLQEVFVDIPFLMPGPVSTGTSQPQLQEVPTTQPTLVSEQGAGEVTQSSIFVTPPSLIPGPISPGAPFPQDATINQVIIDGLAAASSQSQQLNQGASTFPINSIQTPGQLQCVPACMPKCDPQCILEQELLQYDWSQMATGTTPQPKSVGIRPLKVNIVMDDPSQSYPKCKYGCAQQCAQQCGMRSDQEYCLKMCENSCEKSCLSKA
ncbi:hypothetical protein RB195_020808 [Necator americanus]|uniref:Uncharacterized protein n=1 Tax=Necator americanus TaxID=51031 RepID=A0ABR1CKM0_NECAM